MESVPLFTKEGRVQAVLNTPEIKVTKPSDTRWLARERCVRCVRQCLPALVCTFEEIHEGNEAYTGNMVTVVILVTLVVLVSIT